MTHLGYKLNEGHYVTVILKNDDIFWCHDDLRSPSWQELDKFSESQYRS